MRSRLSFVLLVTVAHGAILDSVTFDPLDGRPKLERQTAVK